MSLDERPSIDPNHADREALCRLPGVGPALADRIVAARPFESLQGLTRVPGISDRMLERWRPLLIAPSAAAETAALPRLEAKVEPEGGASLPGARLAEAEEEGQTAGAPPVEAAQEADQPDAPWVEAEEAPQDAVEAPVPADRPGGPGTQARALDGEPGREAGADRAQASPEPPAPAPEQEPPARRARAPRQRRARPQRAATRRYVSVMLFAGGLLTLALSLAFCLGILARLNDNQLRYASPAQVQTLELRVQGLETQAADLAQEVEGLRTRLSSVETTGERMLALEAAAEALQRDVDAAATAAAEVSAQVEALQGDVATLQGQSGQFQAFLDGLQALMESLVQTQAAP